MSEIYKLSGFQQELDKAERFFSMHLTRQELKSRLDEIERLHSIIKEVREKLEYLLTHDKVEINGTIYLKQEADDYITNYILDILDKENKE